jgi:hypothetical protein
VLESAEPRKGKDVVKVLRARRAVVAYSSSHENVAGDGPDPCSSRREYRWRKKM